MGKGSEGEVRAFLRCRDNAISFYLADGMLEDRLVSCRDNLSADGGIGSSRSSSDILIVQLSQSGLHSTRVSIQFF
jgi:hypothetical protein